MDMFAFECMLALAVFAGFFGVVYLLVTVQNLRQRIGRLEKLLTEGTISAPVRPAAAEAAPATPVAAAGTPRLVPSAVPLGSGTTSADRLVRWLREDWLLKLGALLLLFGFAWLATYAFLNNWIGPMGRIALGLVAGAAILLLGWWRIRKYRHQGGIFLILGSTTILITIFAARTYYDFFTPLAALIVMFMSTAFVALASVKQKSRPLAVCGLILAGVAPLLTHPPQTDQIGLFSYLLIVTLGVIWVVFLTGWRELTLTALALVAAYSVPIFFDSRYADHSHLLPFSFGFGAIFYLTNSAGIIRARSGRSITDLIAAAGTGLFLLIWIRTCAPDEWQSLIICAWLVAFVVGAFLLTRATNRREPFYVYTAVGAVLLAAATAVELDGAALTIAYTIECAALCVAGYYLRRDLRLAQWLCLLFVVPMALSVSSITSNSWLSSVFHRDFFVLAMLALTMIGLGTFFRQLTRGIIEAGMPRFGPPLIVLGSLYSYVLLWQSLHAALASPDRAVTLALVIYTIIGLASYLYGRGRDRRGLVVYGGVLLAFVVGRLLAVDVWRMELSGRIITFFLVGALLMSTAFWARRRQKSESGKSEKGTTS